MSQATQGPTITETKPGPLYGWLLRYARPLLVVYWVCLAAGTHWPDLILFEPVLEGQAAELETVLRPDLLLHWAGFGGLMFLLALAGLIGKTRSWSYRCAAAVGIALAYSLTDETTQGLVSGREVSLMDIVSNSQAILAVYICLMLPKHRLPMIDRSRLRWAIVLILPLLVMAVLSSAAWRLIFGVYSSVTSDEWRKAVPADTLFHGIVPLVISIMVFVAWPMASKRPRRAAAWAIVILIATGPGIEVMQYFSGRNVQASDALAHAIGVLVAMTWWAARLARSPQLREPAPPPASDPTDPA